MAIQSDFRFGEPDVNNAYFSDSLIPSRAPKFMKTSTNQAKGTCHRKKWPCKIKEKKKRKLINT